MLIELNPCESSAHIADYYYYPTVADCLCLWTAMPCVAVGMLYMAWNAANPKEEDK